MLTDYSLKMPKEVYGGEHALEKLKDVMSVNDVKKVAVFTDHGIRGTGLLELPMQMLTQAGVETVILDDLPAEPTYSQVQVLVDAFRAEKADIIVAVGGGSVMDAAKLASILSTDRYSVHDLLDEPTLGIDPEGMRELLNLIRELSVKDGRTVLISSHQLQQIQQVCDRVGIYVQGSLIACGTLAELEAQIQKNGTYLLEVDVEPCDDQILGMLSAQQGILKIEKEGRRFMITSKKDIRPQLTKFLGEHDYTVMHLHQRGGDLDEIYRRYFEKAGQNDESNESKTKKKYSWKHKSGSN